MTQIVELKGTEKRLYQLVAPLVMNPVVLKQNYNYPFRTSENFIWFIAVEGKEIVGFIPLEHKKSEAIIKESAEKSWIVDTNYTQDSLF